MRVHYPKLYNIVHTFSLCMFLLLPKDQTFIFYSWTVCQIALVHWVLAHSLIVTIGITKKMFRTVNIVSLNFNAFLACSCIFSYIQE